MKAFFLMIALPFAAEAAQVVLRNPLFQGRPIVARRLNDAPWIDSDPTHAVCRLYGMARASFDDSQRDPTKAKFRTQLVARPDTEVFFATSIMDPNWPSSWSLGNRDPLYPPMAPLGLLDTPRLRFERQRRPDACTEISVCRGFHPEDFHDAPSVSRGLNPHHPFVRRCQNWANRARAVLVYSEITCETTDSAWQQSMVRDVEAYHRRTGNRFRVTSGTVEQLGGQLADPRRTCAGHDRAASGAVLEARVGECDFIPWVHRGPISDLLPNDLTTYGVLTGRLERGNPTRTLRTRQLLAKYHHAVVRQEYGIPAGLIDGQAFCVERVAPVTTRATSGGPQCAVEVTVRDFLQAPTTLRLSLGAEGTAEVGSTCAALARDFAAPDFSCAQAGFCPAPGTLERRTP